MSYDHRLSIWENFDLDLKTLFVLAVILTVVMIYEYIKDKDGLKKQENAAMIKRAIATTLLLFVATLVFSVIRANFDK